MKLFKSAINFQNVSNCELFFKQSVVERVWSVLSHADKLRQQCTVVVFEPVTHRLQILFSVVFSHGVKETVTLYFTAGLRLAREDGDPLYSYTRNLTKVYVIKLDHVGLFRLCSSYTVVQYCVGLLSVMSRPL